MNDNSPAYRPTDFSAGERLDRLTGIIRRGSMTYAPKPNPIAEIGGYEECRRIVADAIRRGDISNASKLPRGDKGGVIVPAFDPNTLCVQ